MSDITWSEQSPLQPKDFQVHGAHMTTRQRAATNAKWYDMVQQVIDWARVEKNVEIIDENLPLDWVVAVLFGMPDLGSLDEDTNLNIRANILARNGGAQVVVEVASPSAGCLRTHHEQYSSNDPGEIRTGGRAMTTG